jgi:hypothetical protein
MVFEHAAVMPVPQKVWPVGQAQAPAVQLRPLVHALPQVPQLALSVCAFTQVAVMPEPQAV